MRAWIKVTLLVVAAFALCWGGAVIYWQETQREPSGSDLALYLLVLPLSLLAMVWAGRKLLSLRAAAPAAAGAPAAASAAPAAAVPALAVLGGALRTPHGAAPDELAGAVEEQRARPDLDPELVDDDGYPIMSARLPQPPDTDLRVRMEAWLADAGHADVHLNDEQWRALGLGTEVALELAAQALAHPHAAPAQPGVQAPMLQTVLLLSSTWTEGARAAAGAWIAHAIADGGWPAARVAVSVPAGPLATPAACLTQLTAHAANSGAPMLAMLVACDSQIGEAAVNRLSASGRLMVAARPQGVVPGEGAAGLLLGDAAQPKLMDLPALLLHPVSGAREGSADASRRPDAAMLRKLTDGALKEAQLEAPAVALVVADTDHRTTRAMELMALTNEALPHLDPAADVCAVGSACGHCGAVPYLAALALARAKAIELDKPVLCVSNDDPLQRGAALVLPAPMPS